MAMYSGYRRRGRSGGGGQPTDPPKLPPPSELVEHFQGITGLEPAIWAQSELDALGNFAETWLLFSEGVLLICQKEEGADWQTVRELRQPQLAKLETHGRGGATVVEAVLQKADSVTSDPSAEPAVASQSRLAEDGTQVKETSRQRLLAFPEARGRQFSEALQAINAVLDGTESEARLPPAEAGSTEAKRRRAVLRMFRFAKPYLRFLLLILFFMTLSTLAGLVAPYMSKLFIDFILKPEPETGLFPYAKYLPWAVLAFMAAHALQLAFGALQARCAGYVGHRTVYDIRGALYEKLQELSLSFFDKHQTGTIIARVNQDTAELRRLLVDFLPLSLEGLFTLIGVGALLLVLNWRMTLLVMIPISSVILAMRWMMPRLHSAFHRYFSRRSLLSGAVADSISGMRVVKAFGQGDEEIRKFDRFSGSYRDAGISLAYRWALYHPFMHFLIILGTVVVWWVGGQAVIGRRMTVGSLVAYSGYLMMFYRPVFMLTRMFQMIVTSISASERIFDVLDAVPEVQDAEDALPLPRLSGEIEFREVTFGYNPHKPVIKDMSFHIRPDEVIGLVGKSGAGKSTIINLIARLYDATRGQVLIDGNDVRKVRHADLRKQIGVVLQETFLFSGSIYENIAYARPEASREEVLEAAEAANAHEFILKKPDAYDTQVGERGNRLSGGEKQRIAIARAILRNPRILILDEATSSVDTETEGKIQQALEKLTRGRTTIAIAHRLSTLRNCDRLFVIEDGRLEETGSHAELLKNGGIFADLVKAQREMSEIIAVNG